MRVVTILTLAGFLVGGSVAEAKKKKAKPAPTEVAKAEPAPEPVKRVEPPDTRVIPPGDKRLNEGAQGRKNATEDAAISADSPQWEHRP